MKELKNGIAYVVFVFRDGTRQTIRTTLNQEILKRYGVTQRDKFLYDISHAEYVRMRDDAVSVEVSKEKQHMKGGVLGFADRFI